MKKTAQLLIAQLMLALVLLGQVFLPLASLKADCTPGNGPYTYDYNPTIFPNIHGDWTESNVTINGAWSPLNSAHSIWAGASTGSVSSPDGNSINIGFYSQADTMSGTVWFLRQNGGAWMVYHTETFTNTYSFSVGIPLIYRYGDCYNGYKVSVSLNNAGTIAPYIHRYANN